MCVYLSVHISVRIYTHCHSFHRHFATDVVVGFFDLFTSLTRTIEYIVRSRIRNRLMCGGGKKVDCLSYSGLDRTMCILIGNN